VISAGELMIREAVRDTLARYNHAGDRGRPEELAAQFTPDGILEIHGGNRFMGRAAIAEGMGGVVRRGEQGAAAGAPPPFFRHHVSNVLIHDVTARRAQAESYFAALTRNGLDHWGRYRDILVPCDGRWLLSYRLARTDGHAGDSRHPGL
jgi:hypothetical protein